MKLQFSPDGKRYRDLPVVSISMDTLARDPRRGEWEAVVDLLLSGPVEVEISGRLDDWGLHFCEQLERQYRHWYYRHHLGVPLRGKRGP